MTDIRFTKIILSFGICSLMCNCLSTDPEMWEKYKIPSPQSSWSEMTVNSEPLLAKDKNLSLIKATEIALNHHPDLVRQRSLFQAANSRVNQALSQFFPQLSLNAGYSHSTNNSSSLSGSHRASQIHWNDSNRHQSAGLELSQLIFDFGQTNAAHKQTKHRANAAQFELENVVLKTLLEVRESYFTYLEEMALLEVSEQTVANFEKHLDRIQKFLAVGRGIKADVARTEVDLAEARLEKLRNQNRLQKARLTLNAAMGLEEDPGYRVDRNIPQHFFDISQKDAVLQSRESRPDLKVSWEEFKAAEQSLIQAKGGYYPSLSLGGSYGLSGSSTPWIQNWSFGPSLRWNIFDSLSTSAEIEEARALLREKRAALAKTKQLAYLEVSEAWLDNQEAKKRMALAKESIRAAEESLKLAKGRYDADRGILLEQTTAELSLARARVEEVSSRFDYERASVRLLENIGLVNSKKKK